jgi:hypothetical protein
MVRGGCGGVAARPEADAPGTRVTVAVEIPARSEADVPGTRVTVAVEMPAFSTRVLATAPIWEFSVRACVPVSVLVSCGRALLLTKRCSRGSKTMEESLLKATTRDAGLPDITVRERRAGGAEAATLLVNASRGGCLRTFQFVPVFPITLSETPRPLTGRTPWARLIGALPRASIGWTGTSPVVPPE